MRTALCIGVFGFLSIYASSAAEAGLFGGFAKDGRYLRLRDQVCEPVVKKDDSPSCQTADAAAIAGLNLSKGKLQQGVTAKVEVKKLGTTLEVMGREAGESLFVWDSGGVIGGLGEVYLDEQGKHVAIEYRSRFGGRTVEELVVVRLANALTPSLPPTPPKPDDPPPVPGPIPIAGAQSPAFNKAMALATKWEKRGKHKQAIVAFKEALAAAPKHPEVLYRLARSQMARKDKKGALASLQALSTSTHPELGRWRVEARFDKSFKSLRLDPVFRSAVGIDRAAGQDLTSYERFVGVGGRWEQAAIPCEQAEVDLKLKRGNSRPFNLVIRSKCQGSTETTRLDGNWSVGGADALRLKFPNTDSDDENLMCQIELCSDSSGEDCLRCKWDSDEILFRTVRR